VFKAKLCFSAWLSADMAAQSFLTFLSPWPFLPLLLPTSIKCHPNPGCLSNQPVHVWISQCV
jgi:hypothetical protein